jgi:hypothetical protein
MDSTIPKIDSSPRLERVGYFAAFTMPNALCIGAISLVLFSCLQIVAPVPVRLPPSSSRQSINHPCTTPSCDDETSPRENQDPQLNLSARAWLPRAAWPGFKYPEELLVPELQGRANSAVCFSGGGLRSFLSSLGYLSAMSQLGLMKEVCVCVCVCVVVSCGEER